MNSNLKNLSLEKLWRLFPIVLKRSAYRKWKHQYIREEINLTNLTGDFYRITHIGSTAVKGIIAKPIVDILLEIKSGCNTENLINVFCANGYIYLKQEKPPFIMFVKGYTEKGFAKEVFHVHVRFAGEHPELYFKDYLNEYKSARRQYAKLKKELAKKYKNHRDNYTSAKTEFVKKISTEAMALYKDRYKPKT